MNLKWTKRACSLREAWRDKELLVRMGKWRDCQTRILTTGQLAERRQALEGCRLLGARTRAAHASGYEAGGPRRVRPDLFGEAHRRQAVEMLAKAFGGSSSTEMNLLNTLLLVVDSREPKA